MNRFAKTVLIAIMLLAMPLSQLAQQTRPYHGQSTIEFDITNIANFDERIFFLYNLTQDNRLNVIASERDGIFVISGDTSFDDFDLEETFAEFLEQNATDFARMDKVQAAEVAAQYKGSLPNEFTSSLMMDYYVRSRQNNTCANADPFCTDNGMYQFPAGVNAGSGESGPFYDCLSTRPNPAWYYMQIDNPGSIDITMFSTPSVDIDFCCWGPFSDPNTACSQLTSDKVVDCSYSAYATEICNIPASSQTGQYYMLVITNYSNQTCNISFSKTGGTGTTNCGILPPLVENDGPYCVGETIHLTANGQAGATYSWSGPGGFTSNQQNPTRPNCTLAMAGTYTCTITLGGQTNSATTQVEVYPQPTANFTATTVCAGEPTQFTSTSTTNPAGQPISGYQWNFGDGQTSTQQNPTHTYANAGNYNVTLTVNCGNGLCTNTKTQTVTVSAAPAANAGPDQTIPYNTSTQLSGSGGAGSFSFHWEPANKVLNPNAQNTQTVTLTQDQTYTLTVTNAQGQCVDTDEVTIHIEGGALAVTANASPSSICYGGSTQLTANAGGGIGTSTYSWTPTTGLSNPNIYNPIANPTQTTTYTCTVTNPQTNQTATATVTVTVNAIIEEDDYRTICPDDILHWHGTPYSTPGTYQFDTVTDQGCDKTIYLHLDYYPTYDETTITHEMCYGESYDFHGTTYTHSIQTSHTLQTVHGCDSIIRLNLTVWPANEVTNVPVSVCPEQLPYTFYGVHYYGPADETIWDTDIHGCDSAVRLILDVSDYFIPAIQTQYECYDVTPTYNWHIPEADTTIVLHEEGFYIDTLHTSSCDGIFSLDLHFQQKPEVEHITVDDACDSYYWPINGQTYYSSGDYEHSVSMHPYPCTKEYRLHLTLYNSNTTGEKPFNDVCDEVDFTWFGDNPHINENGIYTFTNGTTTQGCDSTLRVVVQGMRYTPNPTPIQCSDIHAVVFGDTIAVVTETEFFSFNYDFYIREQGRSIWDECTWSISKPTWRIEPQFSADHKSSTCKVYVAERDNNLVELTCKLRNSCMDPDEYTTKTFYLKSSYVGIDEAGAYDSGVTIVPNPNGGQMRLNFENMAGPVEVKVFDMKGNLVDAFSTQVAANSTSHEYNMKTYADGLYLFVVSDNQRTVCRKVVITH